MGIQGLLPLLKSIHQPTHLRTFNSQTLGIDAYGWLHKGVIPASIELAQSTPTRKHIDFVLSRVRMLVHFGITPYLVFDGANLPSKAGVEVERRKRREEAKKMGLELLRLGRVSQAFQELQKGVDVTPVMARELIEELKLMPGVKWVVAPYEADSQLAYLEKTGAINGVISEDSDLLVFGVKCLITKLDQYGECVAVRRKDFTACKEISLVGWTDREFRIMAMLSGCDYLPGIEKMGLKTAYRLVRKHKSVEKIVRAVQFDGKMRVPSGYLEDFTKAERTFLYQWVFCPEGGCLVNLNKVPKELEGEDMSYLGVQSAADVAVGIACGDLHPNTKDPIRIANIPRHLARQASRSVQTPSEKPGKPISEFFKPVRTPLAELDPNSFTPSPSQQTLLQSQRSTSWSATQAQPMRPPVLNRVATTNGSFSAPQLPRRSHSEQLRKSPKRPRLCADSTPTSGSVEEITARCFTTSRFFGGGDVEPSPSLRKPPPGMTQRTPRKKKGEEFELWSDDFDAEALAEITAIEEVAVASQSASQSASLAGTPKAKKRKKIEVYTDSGLDETACNDEGGVEEESQDTVATYTSVLSPDEGYHDDTPLTSFEIDVDAAKPEEGGVFAKGVESDFRALKARFSFGSKAKSPLVKRPELPSTRQQADRQQAERGLRDDTACLLTAQKMPFPLKPTPSLDKDNSGEDIISEDEEHVVPASSPPISPVDVDKRRRRSTTQFQLHGSEDLLVPQSPESAEDERIDVRAKLDLGRFAFAGR